MADNEITDVGIMAGKAYGSAPLSADMQFLETYTSSALNRKMKGLVRPGFYLGFTPVAGSGLNVVVTSKNADGGQGAASLDVNAHQITVQHLADLTLPVVAGKTTRIVLEANYKLGVVTDQVDITSKVQAARVFAQDLSVALSGNQLELCRVMVPTGTSQVTQAMIITNYRINRQVGVALDYVNDSDDELTGASLKGLKILKGMIDKNMVIANNGSDIQDKAKFRRNIELDQVSNDKQLKSAENLGDLPDISEARKHLGLGSAALANIQKSPLDMTPAALMSVGAFGLGAPSLVMDRSITSLADIAVTEQNAFWTLTDTYTDTPADIGGASKTVFAQMFNMRRAFSAGASLMQLLVAQNGTMYMRTGTGGPGAWTYYGLSAGADAHGWRKIMDTASMTLSDLMKLGAAKSGDNNDITSLNKLTDINADNLKLSKHLEVGSQILAGYRIGLIRKDPYPSYMTFVRTDQVDGAPPASETQVLNIYARLASDTTDAWAGRILGGLAVSNMSHGGGKTTLDARASGGSVTGRFWLDGGDGSGNLQGAGGLNITGGGGITSDGMGLFAADTSSLLLKPRTKDKAYYIRGRKSDDTLHWYLGQSTDNTNAVTLGNTITNKWLLLAEDGTGATNVSVMRFQNDLTAGGSLKVAGGADFTGPVNILAKGATSVGDLTNAAFVVNGSSNDGSQGLSVSSFSPSIAFVNRGAGSRSFRLRSSAGNILLETDNLDNGASWNRFATAIHEKGHLSLAGGSTSPSRALTIGFNTAGKNTLTGSTQIAAMAYSNIGPDATTRAIGWGAELTFGDASGTQTISDAVEFWGNSWVANTGTTVQVMSSFRGLDKGNTGIATAYAFDGRQNTRAGVERWNLYMQGTAPNYMRGQTIIGGTNTSLPDANIGLDVRADLNVTGNSNFSGASFGATSVFRYRMLLARDNALPYQSFARNDITTAPAATTDVGRINFGYGMTDKDSWGTGGVTSALIGQILQGGGGGLYLGATNSAGSYSTSIKLDGVENSINFTGVTYFSGSLRANTYIDLGYQNNSAGERQITFYTGKGVTRTAYIKAEGESAGASTLTLSAGETVVAGNLRVSGTVNFDGILNANRHDSCIQYSSSDSTKPLISANYSGAGNFGFWDVSNSGWLLRKDTSDNWIMPKKLIVGSDITSAGEIISKLNNSNNFRAANNTYGAIHRTYNSQYYILATNANDPLGSYNSLRPLTIDLSNGMVTLANGASIGKLDITGPTWISNSLSIGNVATGEFAKSAASINIGDSDSGFITGGDGAIDLYLNNKKFIGFNANGEKADIGLQLISSSADNYRIAYGDTATFWRNDGLNFHLMFTKPKDQYGTYSSLRPLYFELKSGDAYFGHQVIVSGNTNLKSSLTVSDGLSVGGNAYFNGVTLFKQNGNTLVLKPASANTSYFVQGRKSNDANHWYLGQGGNNTDEVSWGNYLGGTTITLGNNQVTMGPNVNCVGYLKANNGVYSSEACLASDGNVLGSMWGGWLQNYLVNNFITSVRLGAKSTVAVWNAEGWNDRAGYVITGVVNNNSDQYIDNLEARPIQYCINGRWYTAGSA